MAANMLFCEKCKKTMDEKQFYSSKRLDKYPSGKFNKCKKCQTMHVNNWEPETFLPILEDADVPYVQWKWEEILNKYCGNPETVTGMTVLGRYFSQMKLVQFKKYHWEHSDKLNEEHRQQVAAALEDTNMTEEEKDQIINKELDKPPEGYLTDVEKLQQKNDAGGGATGPSSSGNPFEAGYSEADMLILQDLTEDDRKMLLLKWGVYTPSEWVQLEQLYQDMLSSYDIQTAGHKDTLKLACKASLKSNKLLDIGDMEGAKKAVSMYDTLMKSGKFTAAQNKAESGEAIDSVGELALLCEKEEGFIPQFYTGQPNDCVDDTLEDIKRYLYNLVVNEQGLGDLIENALTAMQRDSEKEDAEDIDFEDIEAEIQEDLMTTEDYEEQQEFLDEEKALSEVLASGLE